MKLRRLSTPCLLATVTVGLMLGGLLVGYEPVGGDPDRLYRPLKSELARALHEGRLPFWSDRFGLGVPLVAESHVAAFYPLNLIGYRLFDVSTVYRLAMWLHYVALAAATYAYARCLGITPWGGAIAGLAFTFCGFQMIHSSHEPFYHALPYMMLALFLTEMYVASGRLVWLALLALAWGVQLTLGHFQIQMWTGGLVLVTGLWRVLADRRPWRRAFGLGMALAWGAAVAALQLKLTWELAQIVGFTRRSLEDLSYFSFPPAHWAELAVPRLFMGLRNGPEDHYWDTQYTTGYEASLYIGTVPLILSFLGLVATRRDRALFLWKLLVPLSFALATLPRWWVSGYLELLRLPGFGYFRAPGRYTLVTSLGLCLLAGRGFDRTISNLRFQIGLALAILFAGAASVWSYHWAETTILRASLGGENGLWWRLGPATAVWIISLAAIALWRRGRLVSLGPFLVAAVELGVLYYMGTTVWGWSIHLPADSVVLSRLATEPGIGRIAGPLDDLPIRAGLTPAYPYLGMGLPPPHWLLTSAKVPRWSVGPLAARWRRRLGVTHGVWDQADPAREAESLFVGSDRALDRLVHTDPGTLMHRTWHIERYAGAYPPVHVALRAFTAHDERALLERLSVSDSPDEVWFLPEDRPLDSPSLRARSARVLRWDGVSGEIEHDGPCDLVITRTYYPGWTARIGNGSNVPVLRADGGVQAVRLEGSGVTRVSLHYRPQGMMPGAVISLAALSLVAFVLGRATAVRFWPVQRERDRFAGSGQRWVNKAKAHDA